jgi:HEAT repeat protein
MNALRYLMAALLVGVEIALCGCRRAPVEVVTPSQAKQMLPTSISPELRAVLSAEDLDDLGDARRAIKEPGADDRSAIHAILENWEDPQAVANLLLHPTLIPQEMRLATLFRGLREQRVPYYVLAAVCGLADIKAETLSTDNRARVVAELTAVIQNTDDVRAQRASVTLESFVTARDASRVIALLEHPDKTVRHNLWARAIATLKDDGVEKFAAAARASGLSEVAQRRVTADFKEFAANPDAAGFSGPLFAYIPNLREVRPDTWRSTARVTDRKPDAGPDPAADPDAQTPEALVRQLTAPDPGTRRRAATALGTQKAESAIPALVGALRDGDASVRDAVCAALVRIGPKSFGPVTGALRSPKAENRIDALYVLRRLAPAARKTVTPDQLTAIAAGLKDDNVPVRFEAIAVLHRLGAVAKPVLPALFEAASDTNCTAANVVVADAAAAAALRIDPECGPALARAALPGLIAALKGNREFAASFTLALLGPLARDAIPALAEVLKGPRGYSDSLVDALRDIGGDAAKPLADHLKDPKTPQGKREDILWRLGNRATPDDRQIALLIECLNDPTPRIRASAAGALRNFGPGAKAAVPALLQRLGDAELDSALEYDKGILAETLARMGATAVPGLVAAIEDKNRTDLARSQAIRALGALGTKAREAQPALAAVMKDKTPALAAAAAGIFALVGGDVNAALPVLKDGLRHDSALVALAAAAEVERLGPKAGALVPEMVALLKHRDRPVRLRAARAVSRMGSAARPAVPALGELLKAGDGRVKGEDEIAEALKRLGPDAVAALPALIEELPRLEKMSPHPVLETIGNFGPRAKPALPALLRLLEDREAWCHHDDVIKVLGEIGPEGVPALLTQLGKSSEYTRAHAAQALGRIGLAAKDAVPALRKRLSGERTNVRVWAAYALIRITGNSKEYMPVILDAGKDRPGLDLDVADALKLLGPEARPARDLLLEALLDEETAWGCHQRAAHAVGQLHDDADVIVPRLIALMDQPADVSTRRNRNCQHAFEALRLLGPGAKAAVPRLRALAADDVALADEVARTLEKIEVE